MTAVEIEASGKDVGAGETLEGKLRTVRTAAYGHHGAEAACLLDGPLGYLGDVRFVPSWHSML